MKTKSTIWEDIRDNFLYYQLIWIGSDGKEYHSKVKHVSRSNYAVAEQENFEYVIGVPCWIKWHSKKEKVMLQTW